MRSVKIYFQRIHHYFSFFSNEYIFMDILKYYTLQEISFPFMISTLNVTKTVETDLVTFTEKSLNGKLHFLCSAITGTQFLKTKLFKLYNKCSGSVSSRKVWVIDVKATLLHIEQFSWVNVLKTCDSSRLMFFSKNPNLFLYFSKKPNLLLDGEKKYFSQSNQKYYNSRNNWIKNSCKTTGIHQSINALFINNL